MASTDATERFAASASELGIEVAVRSYPEGTRTAIDAAAAVGCDVDQIVKSLVLMADDQPVLVLCSGANRVDLAKVGVEFGGEVRMANADEVRAATGFAIGGLSLFYISQPTRQAENSYAVLRLEKKKYHFLNFP